ncbi:hypothetical protein glysoja_047225, partial [Glycine soja]
VQELDVALIEARKAAYEENNNKSGKTLFIIHQSVDAYILEKILGVNTTKEALDILAKSYEEDAMIMDKILRTLTPRFNHIVVTIEQGTNLEGMKVEELQGILEAQEMRLNE